MAFEKKDRANPPEARAKIRVVKPTIQELCQVAPAIRNRMIQVPLSPRNHLQCSGIGRPIAIKIAIKPMNPTAKTVPPVSFIIIHPLVDSTIGE